MSQYQDCYVAFIDILGFKALVGDEKTSCNDVLDIYNLFDNIIPKIEISDGSSNFLPVKEVSFVKTKIMSDSICIYIDANVEKALFCLVVVCMNIQNMLLKRAKPILVRGAIARGNIYANKDKDITFGPALTQAYLMEEKNAKYPRIIITKQLADQGVNGLPDYAVKDFYDALLFCDDDRFYSVNFLGMMDDEVLYRLKAFVSETLDSTTDSSIREKHLYLDKVIDRKIMNRGNQNA